MKEKTTKKRRGFSKLIPAACMLLISATTLVSSTYAWFTMNKEVSVTGMEVKTKVGSNLLISTTNLDADYTSNTLIQTRQALLEPVSSINGTTSKFFYTLDAKADGSKNQATDVTPYTAYSEDTTLANAVAGKAKYDDDFNKAYGLGDTNGQFTSSNNTLSTTTGSERDGTGFGYVDYIFYLKATTDATNQVLQMTQCDIDKNASTALKTDGTDGVDNDEAWRVAVFAKDITSTNAGTGVYTTADIADAVANQKGLIGLSGSAYFGNTAVSTTTAKAAVVNNGSSGVILDTISDANVTKYYKVVVRLWLEGEDTTCNSRTYAALTDMYSLDLKFELGQGTAVQNISTNTFDADRTSGKTFTGDQYDTTFGE